MPDIGRFFNVDPLAESFYYNSTYAFSENKVTSHVELEGLEAKTIKQIHNTVTKNQIGKNSVVELSSLEVTSFRILALRLRGMELRL